MMIDWERYDKARPAITPLAAERSGKPQQKPP